MPLSIFSSINHQSFTKKIMIQSLLNNFDFALPAQSFNSYTAYWTSDTINSWTHSGRMFVENGTGGAFGFTSCIVPQFLVNQWVTGYSAGILSQYVYLYATSYVLSFWAAVRPTLYSTSHQFSIVIGGTTYYTSTFTASDTVWKQYFVNFSIATSGSYNIVFNFTTPTTDSSIGITQLLLTQSFVNYNFALPSISTNTYIYTGTIPGWTITGYNSIVGSGNGFGFTTCPYTQFLIWQNTAGYPIGTIYQSIYLYTGSYTISFWAAVRGGIYSTIQQVSVIVGGTTYFTSALTTSSTAWTQYFVNFPILTNGIYTITFSFSVATTDSSIGITNILLYKPIYLNNQLSTSALTAMRGLYSFSLLLTTYSGPIAKIRRASDGISLDFYADKNGKIGTALYGTGTSISSWLTSTTGYILTWYDQSGLGNNMIQSNTTYQPQIILTDNVGICLYVNIIAGTNASQLQTINNAFTTSTVVDAHIVLHHKAITYVSSVTFSLDSPNAYSGTRFGAHLPWTDGTYYFDAGDANTGRVNSTSNLIPAGTKVCFSGYKKSSTTTKGFSVNDFTYYEAAGNPVATVSKAGLNFSDGGTNTNTYIYTFALFSKSLYNTNDEVFLKSLSAIAPTTSLIAYYKFDTDTTLANIPNLATGTGAVNTSRTWNTTTLPTISAEQFISSPYSLKIVTTSFWVSFTIPSGSTGISFHIWFYVISGGGANLRIFQSSLGDGLSVYYGGTTISGAFSATFTANTWQHLVCVYDFAASTGKYYLNNVVYTGSFGYAAATAYIISYGNKQNQTTLDPYNGYIDEIQYYPFPLSANQVDSLYNNRGTNV